MADGDEIYKPHRLEFAYKQWEFVKDLLRKFAQEVHESTGDQKKPKMRKINSTFGRWLQCIQHYNRNQLHTLYPLFPMEPSNGDQSTSELVRMTRDDLKIEHDAAETVAGEMIADISRFLAGNQTAPQNGLEVQAIMEDDEAGGTKIVVGNFRTPSCLRNSFLINRFGAESTALVCLRYEPFRWYTGGESGVSVTGLNALYDVGHARHIGFASPLNCRLLHRLPELKYCSLFSDTDSEFGSLGNFFSIELAKYPGGWILDPPFVEPVMNATAEKIQDFLDADMTGEFWFFITFPKWTDNPGWQLLEQSNWKVTRIDLTRRNFIQQDAYGKVFKPQRLILSLFVFAKNNRAQRRMPPSIDLRQLKDQLCLGVADDRVQMDWLKACDAD